MKSFGRPIIPISVRAPVAAIAILIVFVLTAILAPWIAPYQPTKISLSDSFHPPAYLGGAKAHILGTDKLGRDVLSRIMYGARVSFVVAVIAIGAAGTIGVSLGMLAGYYRGWSETVIMRLVDVQLSIPTVLLALLLGVVWGPSLNNLLLVISLTLWPVYARQAHGQTLSLRERDYIPAARMLGASNRRILAFHILPNLANSIVILATLQIATVVLMEAALSFLGVGIPPPTPAWGLMIAEGRSVIEKAWWVSTTPGIALVLVILSANVTGDWLRDHLDPTMRHTSRLIGS